MTLKETKVLLFSEKRKNMSWKTKGPEFGKLKVGFKEGWICRMMSPIVTHRIKGKTNEMLVASEAGKKPHVKCHTCVVIYTDPGRIRIQKECALQRVFTLGRNKRKWESKNPRQPFFFPSNKLKVEKIHYIMCSFFVSSDIYWRSKTEMPNGLWLCEMKWEAMFYNTNTFSSDSGLCSLKCLAVAFHQYPGLEAGK